MNIRIKIGIALTAIALSGVSFFAGSIHASNRVAKAEADIISREMKLKADEAKFIDSLGKFEEILGRSSKQTGEMIEQLEAQQPK